MMTAFFILMTVVDFFAATVIMAGAMTERMRLFPVWHKIGLIVGGVGLLAQGMRNIQFLLTGISPTDSDLPLWALKDTGYAIVALVYVQLALKKHFSKDEQPAAKPARKTTAKTRK